jgi:23S rRNA-intervening sequence protein
MCVCRTHGKAEFVSRITRVAEVDDLGGAMLPNDAAVQARRPSCPRPRNPQIVRLNSLEHRGRLRAALHARVHPPSAFSGGSSNELQTQIELSKRVEIVGAEEATILIADAEEIGRMLHGLVGSLERKSR